VAPHALILGGTRGLGRAVVETLGADGYRVCAVARRVPPPADRLSGVHYVAADLVDPLKAAKAWDDALAWGGPLSALVAVQRFRGEGDPWQGEIETSVRATRDAVEALAPRFARGGGSIVLAGSVASHLVAAEQPAGYHVAKAALRQLARYYAVVLGPRRIRVNLVSPAAMVKRDSRATRDVRAREQALLSRVIPLGRAPRANEVAGVVAFLCGPRAALITGQDLVIDGGLSLLAHEGLARRLSTGRAERKGGRRP
jgi:NAD(P)-dependent dehydrogenase (short-subunit alcohol dehydrogenase family)